MIITGITTRIIEFDASPRFGGKPIPPGRPKTWKYPLVTVHTDAGIEGYSMIYGPHGDGPAMADILHQTYLFDIVGENPLHSEAIWNKLNKKNRHFYNLSGTLLGVLDVAIWDIKGKIAGLPIVQMLGQAKKKMKAYASGHTFLPSPEEIYKETKEIKEKGYHA